MLARAAILWFLGLLTVVPYATYHLLYHAPREQYALLITLVLFWLFGYWSVVGPLLAVITVRRVFRALERARSRDDVVKLLSSREARELAIDRIAAEHGIPRFLAVRVYGLLVRRLSSVVASSGAV